MSDTWSGFHRLSAQERLQRLTKHAGLSPAEQAALTAASALPPALSESFVENALGSFPIPLGVAVGFVIDGRDTVVPMAVEESSVIAAACHGAKLAAAGGGFVTKAMPPVTIGQIELRNVPSRKAAEAAVKKNASKWRKALNATIPSMTKRGGGVRNIIPRMLPDKRVVVHIHVDTRDAMGANVVNTLCETAAPWLADATGGTVGLRILSNLATERLVTATCKVPVGALGGPAVAQAIVEANDFAVADPYRAATHNKGILNGIDPVVIATGNDWRAVEAGVHAFAAQSGQYGPLTKYRLSKGHLLAELELPLSIGTVGGVTRLHPTAAACLKLLGSPDAIQLARIMAAVGLAQNLSALRALATEGIQKGHMKLHAANLNLQKQAPK